MKCRYRYKPERLRTISFTGGITDQEPSMGLVICASRTRFTKRRRRPFSGSDFVEYGNVRYDDQS